MKKNNDKVAIILIAIIVISFVGLLLYLYIDGLFLRIINVKINNYVNEEETVNIEIKTSSHLSEVMCYISEEETENIYNSPYTTSTNSICSFYNIKVKDYYIYLKYPNDSELEKFKLSDFYKDTIDIKASEEKIYLAPNETYKINAEVVALDEKEETISYQSENESIVSVKNNVLTGISAGTTNVDIKTESLSTKLEVIVTDLISVPTINNERAFLECHHYSEEEANLLDDIIKTKIENAGYKTRAGVVEAARFLTLRFPYRVNYFVETGRLNNYDKIDYVDGEGRYYHQGLYLSESKYQSLRSTQNGPAMWGCPLAQDNGIVRSNGFDCSGFVTWVLYNGGFDVKDTGAGFTDRTDDVADLGEFHYISYDLLKSGQVKPGDLIGSNGHAAIIAGMDNDHVYIAESLVHNVGVTMLTYTYEELAASTKFTYIALMDKVYKIDGNYDNVWY